MVSTTPYCVALPRLVNDEGSLLPMHGDGKFSVAMPNRLGRFVNSDDRQCFLLLASPEDSVELLEPSGAAPVPRVTRALQDRQRVHASHRPVPCMPRYRAPCELAPRQRSTLGGGVRQDLCRTRAGDSRPGIAEEVRVGECSLRLLLPCRLHAGCISAACDPMAQSRRCACIAWRWSGRCTRAE